MTRDDWFRRTTWTEADQREFFARNRRSRGPDAKAQYMRIQAESLLHTRQNDLLAPALALLEQTFREYPNANDRALAYDCAGRCCALLGRSEDALTYYRRALEREREYPGLGTNAPFHLAELVAKQNRTDLFDEVLNALDTFGAPVFPWHAYYDRGFRALVAATRGNAEAARRLAREALQAAAVKDTGLGWGRGALGTVTLGEIDDGFHASLARIGRPNK